MEGVLGAVKHSGRLLDLRETRFVDISGMVALVCASERLSERERPQILWPQDGRTMDYFHWSGLAETLATIFAVEVPANDRPTARYIRQVDGTTEVLLPASAFTLQKYSLDDSFQEMWLGQVVERTLLKLSGESVSEYIKSGSFRHMARALWTISIELAANAREHSSARSVYLAAFAHTGTGRALDVAISDPGVGIPATIAYTHPNLDDTDALRVAFEAGGTSTDDKARGMGLPIVAELVEQFGGLISVRSGFAHLKANAADRRIIKREQQFEGTFYTGPYRVRTQLGGF